MRFTSLCLLLFCFSLFARAQDPMAQNLKQYGEAKENTNLFVHFDKNVYTNNETVWFTAYLLKGKSAVSQHKLISIALIRDIDSTVVVEDRFPMQNGLAFGSLVLPDSILTGNYHLLAFTDRLINNRPEVTFIQSIIIKTNIEPAFKASMKLAEPNTLANKSHKVLVSVTSKDNRFLPKPTSISYRYGNSTKTTKTDVSGQLLLDLPKQTLSDPNLYVKLKYERDSSLISMALPQENSRAWVKFYPEGGNLIAGLPMNIGWEVKDQSMMPIALKAFLYKNNKVIDTIETSSYGIGKFRLYAEAGVDYTVKLIHSGLADSAYHLPLALNKGISLSMAEAVVTDSLRIGIRTNGTRKLNIRIHNFRESFLYVPFDMEADFRTVKISLTEVPKGLQTLTISDSLDRPLAERMFFAHYNNEERLKLTTDQTNYAQRQKVNLKLTLNDQQEDAVVSIACVQNNRIDLKKITDIESYTYLNNELNTLPINLSGNGFKDKAYLEQLLLVKGWRRYTWQELQDSKPNQTAPKLDSLEIMGKVTQSKKELKAPLTIGVMDYSKMRLVTTSDKGLFNFDNDALMFEAGKKMFLFVNDKDKSSYKIEVLDPFIRMNAQLRLSIPYAQAILPSTLLNNSELVLKANEKAIRLKEVTIFSKKDNSLYGHGLPGSNACGDYVCRYNILNCRNHTNDIDNTQPIPGRTYSSNGMQIIYQECKLNGKGGNEFFMPAKGIHLQKEFYLDDYKDPKEPAYFSTIYWNYATLLKKGIETELNFFTSDITGRFKIVVQGLTNNDVIYAEKFFEVTAKQKSDP